MMNYERRKQLDHERYLRQRDERLERQRAYYRENREKCREAVKKSQRKRFLLNLMTERREIYE